MNKLQVASDFESSLLSISGLKAKYIGPNNYKVAAKILGNEPIPLVNKFFYFEVKIIDGGKDGMIGIGFCTKQIDKNPKIDDLDIMAMPGQKKNSYGYHGDDGYSFCSGSGEPYGQSYTTGDTIGCYINFENLIVFYTKNGINLGIACYLPNSLEGILYPCIGLRSQESSVEANFGDREFEYSVMNNKVISDKLINASALEETLNKLTKSLEKNPNDLIDLSYRGRVYLIIGRYEEALEDLTKILKIEQDNIIALRYRGEVNYLMKKFYESIADLENLLKIKPNDAWALKALKLVQEAYFVDYVIPIKHYNTYDDDGDYYYDSGFK